MYWSGFVLALVGLYGKIYESDCANYHDVDSGDIDDFHDRYVCYWMIEFTSEETL